MEPILPPDKMSMPYLYKRLVANRRGNEDVVVPADLVEMMSALVFQWKTPQPE
ncbi:hypothetical protein CROQUDRAFT_665070 [Cronartium quercuum f. sp. fusiforme G11]|uniref:Uncharacterized protein n=1 Tax=Cronartium quercuum f. sp. fusiforme G11 TaxID=708437 RepID=A0A9P6N6I4_9BASI|nr:hypothetical protein CROQUDRAFT_665070 [Cronartium quercuum f. sp. fusiforme G11]